MAEGEFALVRQHLEHALAGTGAWVGDHDLYTMLADASARSGDVDALRRYAPLAEAAAQRYDHRLYLAIAHRAWGILHRLTGDYAAAQARLTQALDGFQVLGTRWQVGCTLVELGELALAQEAAGAAIEHFAQALAGFTAMEAAPDVVRTRQRLEALGWRPSQE